MARHRITCIVKPNPENRHEHVTDVGLADDDYLWSRAKVIKAIEQKTDSFYVHEGNLEVSVYVVHPDDGRAAYIRTYSDGKWKDNLLALTQCVIRK